MEEIDLMECIRFFWKRKIIIIISIIILAIIGGIYTKFMVKPLYESSTSIILTKTKFNNEADVVAYSNIVNRYRVIATSKDVAMKVIENLKLDISLSDLQNSINVYDSATSQNIRIHVTLYDAENAAKISNEVAKVFIEEVGRIYQDNDLKIIDYAVVDKNPINIDLISNILKFSIIGGVLACGYILVMYVIKNTNKDEKNDIEDKNVKE